MRKCTGTAYDKEHCQVEKLGCPGCHHFKKEENTVSRKLASVQRIKMIKPIEGADRIEIVQVLNWNCVAKKGEFRVGQKVLYFEIDSLLPDIPEFEWLRGSSWSQKLNKYKISTHKFRNQISQGLVVPVDKLKTIYKQLMYGQVLEESPRLIPYPEEILNPSEGDDLTELLQIEKYDPPVSNGPLGDLIHHEWYVPKTDEERIQVCAQNVLPEYICADDDDWYASIKLDGCSCTAGLFDDAFLIGGRNQWYKDENMYTTTVKKYGDLQKRLEYYKAVNGLYVVFQGELCGPGIQSNKLGLPEKEWFIFNVFVSKTGENGSYVKCDKLRMLKLCEEFHLKTVPIIEDSKKFNFNMTHDIDETVDNLLKYVDGIKYRDYFGDASPNQIAEGVVFRKDDMTNSFKVVSNKYLLKGGE